MKGKVKFWNVRKGWGFIEGEDNQSYFGHWRDIETNYTYKFLKDNESVEFSINENNGKLRARNLATGVDTDCDPSEIGELKYLERGCEHDYTILHARRFS